MDKTLGSLLKGSSTKDCNIISSRLIASKLRKQQNQAPRQITDFHPSSLNRCERALVAQILYWQEQKPNFTPQLLDIFDNGNHVHDRVQKEMINAGIVPMLPGNKRAIEVPITYPKWKLRGRCDGFIMIGDNADEDPKWYIMEIKSINQYQFNQLRKPKAEHYLQGQAYLKMAEETFPHIKFNGIIFYYEDKNTQSVKEYLVKQSKNFQVKLGQQCIKLKKFVEAGKVPKRPFMRDSKECKECSMVKWCWEKTKG
jgi:CRISPR/Cas system-associated exonuclease Cas4 (RecB family)